MNVSSTEIQNNFGKYLTLCAKEDIFITKNGVQIAKLSSAHKNYPKADSSPTNSSYFEEEPCRYTYGYYGGREGTYEEYLKLSENEDERYEYIDGEIYYLASPKVPHQTALMSLVTTFIKFFEGKKCTPMVAPFDITLSRRGTDIHKVQPDVMVICDLQDKLDKRGYYIGVPTLLVEILSESTRSKDSVKKLDLYMWSGVGEYWVINPLNKEIVVYEFKEKEISNIITFKQNDTVVSFYFPELTVEVAKIFSF